MKVETSGQEHTAFSGIYIPEISAPINIDTASITTVTQSQYMRVGNTVTVSGRFIAKPFLTATATSFEISLPIASNIGAIEEVAGTAVSGLIYGLVAAIVGSVSNNTALIRWISSDIDSGPYAYHFTYYII